jgi:hypothetical protein
MYRQMGSYFGFAKKMCLMDLVKSAYITIGFPGLGFFVGNS